MLNPSSSFSPITNTIIMDIRRGGDLTNYQPYQLIAALACIITQADEDEEETEAK